MAGLTINQRKWRGCFLIVLVVGKELQNVHANLVSGGSKNRFKQFQPEKTYSKLMQTQNTNEGPGSWSLPSLRGTVDTVVYDRGLLTATEKDHNMNGDTGSTFDILDQDDDGNISRKEFERVPEDIKKAIHHELDDHSQQNQSHSKKNQSSLDGAQLTSNKSAISSHHQRQESYFSDLFFNSAMGACGSSVVLTMFVLLVQVSCICNSGYTPLGGVKNWFMPIAAFLYWVAMPATMLTLGYTASCDGGPPDLAYKMYGVFALAHLGIAAIGYMQGLPTPPFCDLSDMMGSLSVLVVLTMLEHFDMATDALFPGTSNACNEYVSPNWVESWKQASWGHSFVPVLEALQFGGFALTMFVAAAYTPQVLGLTPFGTLACFLITNAAVSLWVTVSWMYGLGVLVIEHALYLFLVRSCNGGEPFLGLLPNLMQSDENLASYSGILIFTTTGALAQGPDKLLLSATTKLVFENILQLWIQSSAFGLSFAQLDDAAKVKALLSMGLALMVSASKLGPLLVFFLENLDIHHFFLGLLPTVVFGVVPWIWIVAKIYYAFTCDSHIWNLSSGCVEL